MKPARITIVAILLLMLLGGGWGASPRATEIPPEELPGWIRAGGLVIYFRHGLTDWSQTDVRPVDLKDCPKQRRLSPTGRAQMLAIGKAMTRSGIPLGRVLASPYCRTLASARLALGRADPEPRLQYVGPLTGERRRRQVERLRELLGSPPAEGRNTVLMGHRGNLLALLPVDLAEGEAAVFQPGDGADGFRLLGRMDLAAWERMAEQRETESADEDECREPTRLPSG